MTDKSLGAFVTPFTDFGFTKIFGSKFSTTWEAMENIAQNRESLTCEKAKSC